MRYKLSKDFAKSLERLSGKELRQLLDALDGVEAAPSLSDIQNCKKLVSFSNVYRLRVGNRRAFFTLHLEIIGELLFFRYLVARGQAYDKAMEKTLRKIDLETP